MTRGTRRTAPLGAVVRYRRRLARLTRQLRRVNAALAAWEEYDANWRLPPGLRRFVPRPEVGKETLRDLRAILLGEIDAWEQGWLRRN